MQPSDTVKNNDAIKKGPVKLDIPVISWEQDLETYALLPIKNRQPTIVMKWLVKMNWN